ncbi:MAG: acyl-CoA dehydrogenase family protein [Flavobacteriaceae bacterium]
MKMPPDRHADIWNQPPPLADYDAFSTDPALPAILKVHDADWARESVAATGRTTGSAHVQALARQADRNPPELRTHDRFGNRIDQVEFHPAWHELMGLAFGQGVHAFGWRNPRPGGQVARSAIDYLWNQAENGICCPAAMTFASIPVIRQNADVAARWEPLLLSTDYDPAQGHSAAKTGATAGMAMTERQGGSDLRQTATEARPAGDGLFAIDGAKWFFSVPHSDLILTLARTAAGVSCFAVPGWLDDGSRNGIFIQRLKEKCGNRSNASSEIEFRGALGTLVGEEGSGIRTIIEMAQHTRIDCAIGSAALMRQATAQAAHHAAHRRAFQKTLIDQPAMRAVIADLSLEAEAAAWLAFRFAATLDRRDDESEAALSRIGAPIAKYWICKRTPAVVAEALECHGGNGYIEDHLMARLYREAPLNGIWEGSGNVICLDVLRALGRESAALPALLAELERARGSNPVYDNLVSDLPDTVAALARDEAQARRLVSLLARLLAAAQLIRHAPHPIADAYVASRLGEAASGQLGDLPAGVDAEALACRAVPMLS